MAKVGRVTVDCPFCGVVLDLPVATRDLSTVHPVYGPVCIRLHLDADAEKIIEEHVEVCPGPRGDEEMSA